MSEPIAASVREVMTLFGAELEGLRFPDVDLEILTAGAARVREGSQRVEGLQQQLDSARAELDDAHEALVDLARRGLAYAGVYAQGDAELRARIEGLELARPPSPKRRKKRRAPKAAAAVEDTPLPLALAV